MKKMIFVLVTVFSMSAFADKNFGAGAKFADAVPMSKIMKNPESYVGKEVTVSGVIVDVCEKRGCWMQLTSDYQNEKVRIKVNDGEIVFPLESRGKKAAAKGEFKKINLSLEQTKNYLQHIAEENKKPFDPASVKEAMVVYQVQATGAVIQGN
ncbi:DUF4920 domain-containing protein [Bdellovibrio bacteriovorus]|uniref:DUF4920 domain-containing protein n=1 Tax=Bdellovibrio bacteriovorus TaxID=959 RepID=UPI0021D0D2CF|nr:DUF4920 domain-containing protein [Bdellovibrio bacteriovorus]UXR63957.1 DUF4920 domain-containing protein [Bdellovibrio bacteriovorus]